MKSPAVMIEEILIKKDISQQELATELKVAPSQISRWRNGAKPRIRILDRIKKLYEQVA